MFRIASLALRRPLIRPSTRLFSTSLPWARIEKFLLHDIGEGITEVEIIKWHVEPGATVEEFESLCEVQSDKSVAELTSPFAGVLKTINKAIGELTKVGQTLCEIEVESEGDEPVAETEASREEEETVTPVEAAKEELGSEPAGIQAAEEIQAEVETDLLNPIDSAMSSSGAGQFSGEAGILPSPASYSRLDQPGSTQHAPVMRRGREMDPKRNKGLASPAVRTHAARMGIDIGTINGTGPGGRVMKEDLVASIPSSSSATASSSSRTAQDVTKVTFGRSRKAMWKGMGKMGAVPHFGYQHTLDLTALIPHLRQSNAKSEKAAYRSPDFPIELQSQPAVTAEHKTTILSFLVKALLLALDEHPAMRGMIVDNGSEQWLEVRRDPVVSIAVSDPTHGLLTPPLPPLPSSTSLSSITKELAALRTSPRAMRSPANGSITISSVGALGESTGANPVLPPGGGVAIAAIGRAKWEIEWSNAEGKVFEMDPESVKAGGTKAVLKCPVGWSGDHRVLEGAELIAFTESWKRNVEQPWRWLK